VRDRRKYLLLLSLIIAALVGALMLEIPGSPAHKSATLGLDLRGGLEVVLQAQNTPTHKVTSSDLDTAVSIMQSRINGTGITEPEIRKQPPNQIVIQIAGIHDPQRAAQLIGQTAQLELYDLEGDLHSPSIDSQGDPVTHTSLYNLLAPVQSLAKADGGSHWYLFNKKHRQIAESAFSKKQLLALNPKHGGDQVFAVPRGTVVITCGGGKTPPVVCPGANADPTVKNY